MRNARIDAWEAEPDKLDKGQFLAMVESIGKGRFAQRLATRIDKIQPLAYIADAIKFVAERV